MTMSCSLYVLKCSLCGRMDLYLEILQASICCRAVLLTLVLYLPFRSLSQPIRSYTMEEEVEWAQVVRSPRREIQPRVEKPRNNTRWNPSPQRPYSTIPLLPHSLPPSTFLLSPNGYKAKQFPGLKSYFCLLLSSCNFWNVCLYVRLRAWASVIFVTLFVFVFPCFPSTALCPLHLSTCLSVREPPKKPPCECTARLWERVRPRGMIACSFFLKVPHCLCAGPLCCFKHTAVHLTLVREPVWV